MKPFLTFLIIAFFALTLTACATTGTSATATTKCPACGHEFDYQP